MFKKIAVVTGMLLLAVLIALRLIPFFFQKQIGENIRQQINSRVNAEVKYSRFGISFFRNFPNVTISLNDLLVTGRQDFKDDTLLSAISTHVTFGLWDIIMGRGYGIRNFEMEFPVLKLKVNAAGIANWNILKPLPLTSNDTFSFSSTADTSFLWHINKWQVAHADIDYSNYATNTFLRSNDCHALVKQINTGQDFIVNTQVGKLSYETGGISYLQKIRLTGDIDLLAKPNGQYNLKKGLIAINDLKLKLNGDISSKQDGLHYDISVKSGGDSFKDLLSVIPGLTQSKLEQLGADGDFFLDGKVEGLYNEKEYPAISIGMRLQKGIIQDEKKGKLHDIFALASFSKPQGAIDSARFDVVTISAKSGEDTVNGIFSITTLFTNPYINAALKGSFKLSDISQFYDLNDIELLNGHVTVDAQVSGYQNDFAGKSGSAGKLLGHADVNSVQFKKRNWKDVLQVNKVTFNATNDHVIISTNGGQIGKNKFKAGGEIRQLIPYLFEKTPLKVNVDFGADSVDLLALTGRVKQSPVPSNTSTAKVVAHIDDNGQKTLLNGIEYDIHFTAGNATYDKLVLKNLVGELDFADHRLIAKHLSANVFGGKTDADLFCNDYKAQQPDFKFTINTTGTDIKQVRSFIDNADTNTNAPALNYISGAFNGQLSGAGKLKSDYSLDFKTLLAKGYTRFANLKIDEMPVLVQIGKLAKVKSLDHLEARNAQSAFYFKNGNTTLDSTDIKFTSGYRINFRGTNYVNQTVDADLHLEVPVKEFGSLASMAQNLLSGFMSVPDNVKFDFKVTGKNTQPVVKLLNVGTSGN